MQLNKLHGIKIHDDCVKTARDVIARLGSGVIMQLPATYAPNPETPLRHKGMEFGEIIDAHAFTVIDNRYLIDPWADEYLDLEKPEDLARARSMYGEPSSWEVHKEEQDGRRTKA